jgi:DNA-binding SARP family transcriptional activator
MGLRFGVLGPVQVLCDDDDVALPALKQRHLLTALLLQPNRAVPLNRLIPMLWGESPPRSVIANLRTYVSRLRRSLTPDGCPAPAPRIIAQHPGYLIVVNEGELDTQLFTAHQRRGAAALERGDLPVGLEEFTAALGLWRGDAAEDVPRVPELEPRLAALDEQRWTVVESHAQARLALGADESLVGELRTLLAENPVRERLWAFLMITLYRTGNAAGALEVYHQARRASNGDGVRRLKIR